MPAMRERLMEEAFPEIERRFHQAAKQPPPWAALLAALGTCAVTDATRRVRNVNVQTTEVRVPGLAPGTTVAQTTGTVLPHVRVRTVARCKEHELAGFASSGKLDDWARRALRAGNVLLFSNLHGRLRPVAPPRSCALEDLPATLDQARARLGGRALALLVSAAVHERLSRTDGLSEKVARALKGGTMAPVAELRDSTAHVLRHGAGDVVVEVVQALAPHWDLRPPRVRRSDRAPGVRRRGRGACSGLRAGAAVAANRPVNLAAAPPSPRSRPCPAPQHPRDHRRMNRTLRENAGALIRHDSCPRNRALFIVWHLDYSRGVRRRIVSPVGSQSSEALLRGAVLNVTLVS
jgi:hypothetical protein